MVGLMGFEQFAFASPLIPPTPFSLKRSGVNGEMGEQLKPLSHPSGERGCGEGGNSGLY